MNSSSLHDRITDLTETNKQVNLLIQRLLKLHIPQPLSSSTSSLPSTSDRSDEEDRGDLTAEIHETLKQQEEDIELLVQDVEDAYPAELRALTQTARRGATRRESQLQTETERESTRLRGGCARLEEDLKLARFRFRRAQRQAKRNADAASAHERNQYLESLRAQTPSPDTTTSTNPARAPLTDLFAGRRPRKANKNSTQDDILLSATSDVTSSLRRTHDLLASELSRSYFAHDTLTESNAALEELTTKYRSLDDILATSRGLLGSLLRSQKSDTWYLETAFYLLLATIAWLIFRRLLYGPLWWLVWWPVSLLWRLTSSVIGTALSLTAASTTAALQSPSRSSLIVHRSATGRPPAASGPAVPVYQPVGAGGAHAKHDTRNPSASLAADIADMVESGGAAMKSVQADAETAAARIQAQNTEPQDKTIEPNRDSDESNTAAGDQPQEDNVAAEDAPDRPVVRGDGTVLPPRDPEAQPPNPKRRVWDAPREEGAARQEL